MENSHIYQFRVIVVGDSNCGKSSLVHRLSHNIYNDDIGPTIGVDYFLKVVQIGDKIIRFQIWDTAGQEKFRTIVTSYYRNAIGVVLAYDVSQRLSFERLKHWMMEAKRYTISNNAVFQVIACKDDLEREVSTEEGKEFADGNGLKFIETSSKVGNNIEEAFLMLAKDIYDKNVNKEISPIPVNTILGEKFNNNHLKNNVNCVSACTI